jgi:chemotaxis methyl-accepting protein methylase
VPIDTLLSLELSERQFNEISDLVKSLCGINLHDGKKELVKARLTKRLRKLNMCSFADYMDLVKSDAGGNELTNMLDALSTNLTSFFRENEHFEYLAKQILPGIVNGSLQGGKRLRIWSAGCSSGEEPYTIGMVANDNIPALRSWDAKILATDISTRVLARAAKRGLRRRPGENRPAASAIEILRVHRNAPRSYISNNRLRAIAGSLRAVESYESLAYAGSFRCNLLPQRNDLLRQGHSRQAHKSILQPARPRRNALHRTFREPGGSRA